MPPVVTREMMTAYNQSEGGNIPDGIFIREVPDFIETIRRFDTPMLKLVKPGGSRNIPIFEYGEGDLLSKQTQANGAHTSTITVLTVDDSSIIQKWQKLRNTRTDEIVLVTDPAYGTNQVQVVRDWPAQTGTGTAMNDNDVLHLLGPAIPEGADAVDSPIQMGEVFETYPEIKEYTWKYSNRARKMPTYEVKTDQFKHQLKKKMKEAALDLNRDLLSGKKNRGDDSGTNPSTMGGLREATATYSQDVLGAALGFDDLMDGCQTLFADVGRDAMGKDFMGSMFVKRIWNSYFQKARQASSDDKKLRLHWDEVDSDFGRMRFFINYDMDDTELILWNADDAKLLHMEGGNWSSGLYSTQGWYDRGFLRCDMGPVYEAARRRFRWHNFSKTKSDYSDLDVPAYQG